MKQIHMHILWGILCAHCLYFYVLLWFGYIQMRIQVPWNTILTAYEQQDISSHQQFDCLLESLISLILKQSSEVSMIGPL